jgi:hypothetical protein
MDRFDVVKNYSDQQKPLMERLLLEKAFRDNFRQRNLNYPCAVAVADPELKKLFDQACLIAMLTFRGLMEIFAGLEGRQ